jgi:c-di-GMP-binding flagellar brake protein YcgR
MQRIGVKFVELRPAIQAQLDAFVFIQIRAEARAKWHLRGMPAGGDPDRRRARRVAVIEEDLTVKLQPAPEGQPIPLALQARLLAAGAAPLEVRMTNVSHSGCAFLIADGLAPEAGTEVELEIGLAREGLSLRVRGRVVYALAQP